MKINDILLKLYSCRWKLHLALFLIGSTFSILLGHPASVRGEAGYTTTAPFYAGIDLTTGISAYDRRTLIISLGAAADLKHVPDPEDLTFQFPETTAYYLAFDPAATFPVRLIPEQHQRLAVLRDTPLEAVDAGIISSLEFLSGISAVSLNPTDAVVFLTSAGMYWAIGAFEYHSETWTVSLTAKPVEMIAEPDSFILWTK